jgi:hypothetical protein
LIDYLYINLIINNMIKFYKGDAAKYNPEEHGEGIYFTNDTSEILHNNISYSGKKDYTSSLEDKTLETSYDIGGIKKGTKVEDLEGKTYNDLFDEILFPTVYPTFVDVSASISLKPGKAATREIGSAAPKADDFATSYNPGSIILNGVKQADRGGAHDTDNSFIYYGNNADNRVLPTIVSEGNTSYKYRAAYAQGPQPIDSKKNDYDRFLDAGTVDSDAFNVNGTWPWYASTVTAGSLTKQSLISWDTNKSMHTGEFTVKPHSKDLPQMF